MPNKTSKSSIIYRIVLSAACGLAVFSSISNVLAEEAKIDVSQENAIKGTLQALVGKSATVTTVPGETLTGIVEAVGPDSIKLSQLSGKEFYSAVIKLDSIASVVFRAR